MRCVRLARRPDARHSCAMCKTMPAMNPAAGCATRMDCSDDPLLLQAGGLIPSSLSNRLSDQTSPMPPQENDSHARFAGFGPVVRVGRFPAGLPHRPRSLVGRFAVLNQAARAGTGLGDDQTDRLPRQRPVCALWLLAPHSDQAQSPRPFGRRMQDFGAHQQPALAVWPARKEPFATINSPEDPIRAEVGFALL